MAIKQLGLINNMASQNNMTPQEQHNSPSPESLSQPTNCHSRGSTSEFWLPRFQTTVRFTSAFDSGNGNVVKQLSPLAYKIQCASDGSQTGHSVNSKSWFYFRAEGFPKHSKVKMTIVKVQALLSLYYSKWARFYRPVYRVEGHSWRRVQKQCELTLNEQGEVECLLEHEWPQNGQSVQFAFCYPYQFSSCLQYIQGLSPHNDIYFHRETLVLSPQKRPVHLLTITNKTQEHLSKENQIDESLFPEKNRPLRFRKPVVLISARVHPGESVASYAMEGVIDFLLNREDLRAHMLRDMFVFMVVPMINVDGVYNGHFRMDTFGHNLNRFYINPNLQKQPAIYGIKALARHLIRENRLCFYCDLHGHNAKKGCFIYGNAFPDFVEQVESQVFCKLLAINHPGFEYEHCNFSQRHMNAKDRYEDLTKEGCGRVVMHREANITHSYSLQCGSIAPSHCTAEATPVNPSFTAANRGLTSQKNQKEEGVALPDGSVLFTEDAYRSLGKSLLVSILDVFDKNPYNLVYGSRYTSMQMLRRVTAFEIFHSAERFRMFEKSIFGKVKNINTLVQESLYSKPHYRGLFNEVFTDTQLNFVEWPKNIPGLSKVPNSKGVQSLKNKKGKSLFLIEQEEPLKEERRNCENEQKDVNKEDSIFVGGEKEKEDENVVKGKQNIVKENENDKKCEEEIDEVLETARKHKMDFNKRASDLTIHEDSPDLDSDSDESDAKDTELNQEILLLCQSEKEQKALMAKILGDNFGEEDYQQLQSNYRSKSNFNRSDCPPETAADKRVPVPMREMRSSKEPKYRMNRKVVINTCDVTQPSRRGEEYRSRPLEVELKRPSPAEEFRKNIYDAIKVEIKEGLRREYDRRRQRDRMNLKMVDSFKPKNNRTRSNYQPTQLEGRRMRSKVKLPSLGTNMYIITTSTRILHKT